MFLYYYVEYILYVEDDVCIYMYTHTIIVVYVQ